ncbi:MULTISPECIES: hypothetical protein [Halobacterium]|uniref:hypothetical protein n=1 Tax=Halobacterium TaxID=2239 RepID=UPI0009E97A46|nr:MULTISPECIES: hypothetical protein [Halobacterium]MCG1002085.1 hypothetical protein [Halobacterium noricense]
MAGIRDLLAVVLGVLLGAAMILAPRAALRLSVFMGPNRRRRGDYGTDEAIPDWWAWLVRALGVVCLAVAGVVAYQTYA